MIEFSTCWIEYLRLSLNLQHLLVSIIKYPKSLTIFSVIGIPQNRLRAVGCLFNHIYFVIFFFQIIFIF
jgi:hypothetical protein